MEISFATFKARTTQRIPKLSLEKDEQARICFLEKAPRMVFTHTFNKVVTGPDGKAIIIKDTWPDGQPRETAKTEYAGKFRCLGNTDELQRSGVDPENCPACRAHIENPNALKAPARRFLGHVLKYSVRPGSFSPTKPFSASLVIWDLTEKRFEQLVDIYNEHGELSEHDLLLGPCENKQMQKYTIQIGGDKAHWMQSDTHKEYVMELLREERVDDIEGVAGKLPSEFEMDTKVNEIVRAYNHAYGLNQTNSYESLLGSSNVDQVAAAADATESPASPSTPDEAPAVEEASPAAVETSEEAEETEKDSGSADLTGSLDELLARLGG